MKTILKIFKNDLIGIKKSILTIVLAVGLCILPALYAWFNIFANGDPYANTGNINIAVVNLDKGYTDADGNEMNMGQSVVDKLKSQTSIGWVFPESEKSAIGGVKSGTYYAAVVIDEDFSYNMFNALTDTEEALRQLCADLISVQQQAEELFLEEPPDMLPPAKNA